MIGPPKIGKSEFFSYGDKTLYIQTEAGLNHLSVMKLPCREWQDFRDIYSALLKAHQAKQFPYDTIVIDTVDNFIDCANTEVVSRGRNKFKAADVNVIGDIPNGAGWAWSTELVDNALAKLEELPACIVLIGHLDNKEIKQPNNVSIHKQTISIGGKTGRSLVAWADHLINLESTFKSQELVRKVRTRPTATLDAGSRGNVIPDGWIWDSDNEVNYKKLRGLFK